MNYFVDPAGTGVVNKINFIFLFVTYYPLFFRRQNNNFKYFLFSYDRNSVITTRKAFWWRRSETETRTTVQEAQ